jgi:hypothetical protein
LEGVSHCSSSKAYREIFFEGILLLDPYEGNTKPKEFFEAEKNKEHSFAPLFLRWKTLGDTW